MSRSSTSEQKPYTPQFYWGFGTIPELAELPSAERGAFWRKHHGKAYRHWQTWVGLGVVALSAVAPQIVVDLVGLPLANHSFVVPALCALSAGLGGLVFGQLLTTMARPHLREALDRRCDEA
jgi:hypothetical protein